MVRIVNVKIVVLCLCLASSWSSAANAATLSAGDVIRLDRTGAFGGARGGGEFTVWKLTSAVGTPDIWTSLNIQTFCLEFNEHIVLGQKLLVGAVSDRAVQGGVGGQLTSDPNPLLNGTDPLDVRTQFLYNSFVDKSLSTLTSFNDSSDAWSSALQETIWYLENEVSELTSARSRELFAFANSYVGPALDSVFVLNLFSEGAPIAGFNPLDNRSWDAVSSYHRQDQVFYQLPQSSPRQLASPTIVPEPASGVLWLSAVCLIGCCARVRTRLTRTRINL